MSTPNASLFPDGVGIATAILGTPGDEGFNIFEPREALFRCLGAWNALVVVRSVSAPVSPAQWTFWVVPSTISGTGAMTPPALKVWDGTAWQDLTPALFAQAIVALAPAASAPDYYAVDTGGAANTIVAAFTTAPASYAAITGKLLRIKLAHGITGASTVNFNGLGVTSLTHPDGSATVNGDAAVGEIALVAFDGAAFQLLDVSAAFVLPAATVSTLGGVKIGAGLNVAGDGTVSAKVWDGTGQIPVGQIIQMLTDQANSPVASVAGTIYTAAQINPQNGLTGNVFFTPNYGNWLCLGGTSAVGASFGGHQYGLYSYMRVS